MVMHGAAICSPGTQITKTPVVVTASGGSSFRYSSVSSTTRYGSPTTTPATAAALLRALATKHSVPLIPVNDTALAAACLAAEGWMEALDADSLGSPSQFGASAAPALGAILRLAATGVVPDAEVHEELADFDRFAGLLTRFDTWLSAWFTHPDERVDAVLFAASCIGVGSDPRLGALAELLEAWAGEC